ncbi:oxidoreductase [Natronomonas sp. EA1]|uniref:oxidoreductase n=1 Tax=Natronomonas sp. EA1 TaxID=3421655 RepID=UPI003EBBDF70
MTRWTLDDIPDQSATCAVVTGANSGLGFETARGLASAGAHVVLACRRPDAGEAAAAAIDEAFPDASLEVRELDLASLDSVKRFARGVRQAHDGLDLLVNNAGVMAIPRRETADGFEMQLGVNHLGHFALTGRLFDALRRGSRVVSVSSIYHRQGAFDFDDLQWEDSYDKWDAYARSKLANLLFAYELQRRLDAEGVEMKSVAAHPGYAATNLQSRGPKEMGSRLRLLAMKAANALVAQSARKGALPTLYAATMPDVEGGDYYGPGGFRELRGYPEQVASTERSKDPVLAGELWRVSEELTGVSFL